MTILGVIASSISGNLYSASYDSIATVTVGAGGSSTITFSSIPSTYTHLQIRGIARSTVDGNLTIRMGAGSVDTGSNYNWHNLYGTGSAAAAGGGANSTLLYAASIYSVANTFSASVIDILDYANTNKFKTIRALDGADTNGAGVVDLSSGTWRSTSAIDTIELKNAGNFTQYSHFALYGIKVA